MNRVSSNNRGFLLLIVIGILAVLLTVCVGFLSFTRGEMQAVSSQRDKCDTLDVLHSAIDWTLASICKDTMDASGNMDPTKTVSLAKAGGNWWYRPYEAGFSSFVKTNWWGSTPAHIDPASTEANWVYLPADYFPGGGVAGRFMVQVLDTNSCININDWNEDCMPSQCQMAHIMMDAYGFQQLEGWREMRDNGTFGGLLCPLRYDDAWRVVTRTSRYLDWTYYSNGRAVDNLASYNWVTSNTSWLQLWGADYGCLHSILPSNGVPQKDWSPAIATPNYHGSTNYYPVDPVDGVPTTGSGSNSNNWQVANQNTYLSGFTTQSYVDPDTGRSPINVNTCYNSGENVPVAGVRNGGGGVPPGTFTMEGVWNAESLRRMIKIGNFWTGTVFKNAQTDWSKLPAGPAAGQGLTADEKMKVEQLKTKLAYQYQETLCRYFTGTYAHKTENRKWPQLGGANIATYAATYAAAPAPKPTHFCTVTDYSAPRFNVPLTQFRQFIHDDFLAMGTSNINPLFDAAHAVPLLPVGQFATDKTDGTVSFDKTDLAQVAPGKLDMRTAAACYDNAIPGKPADISDFGGCQAYQDFGAYPNGDPIFELYKMGLARMEDLDDKYAVDPNYPGYPYAKLNNNTQGFWGDNNQLSLVERWGAGALYYPNDGGRIDMLDHRGTNQNIVPAGNAMNLYPKGQDYYSETFARPAGDKAPVGPWFDNPAQPLVERQRCFTPDSFSTELTTTTTNYILIVNAELVDAATVRANPGNPALHRQLFWNQWGVVIEVAPDVVKETDKLHTNTTNPDFDFYLHERPMYLKSANISNISTGWDPYALNTDPNTGGGVKNCLYSMDYNCAFLVTRNHDENGMPRMQNQLDMRYDNNFPPPAGTPVNPQQNNQTAITDWGAPGATNVFSRGCDIHYVPPKGDPWGRGPDVLYTPANQTQKRIVLRSIWCLNEGIQR